MTHQTSPDAPALHLHHLALRAADLAATVAFYKEVLGLAEVRSELPRAVWLGLSAGAVLMVEARGQLEPAIPAGSRELVAFHVSELRKLAIRGLALSRGCFDGETSHTVYLRDPDGRRVGVSTYPL